MYNLKGCESCGCFGILETLTVALDVGKIKMRNRVVLDNYRDRDEAKYCVVLYEMALMKQLGDKD